MKNLHHSRILLILISVGTVISGCSATDARLSGTWRSNLGLTTDFNQKHAKLTEKQKSVFSQMFGKMELTYLSPGKCEVLLPSNKVDTGSNVIETDESKEISDYKILYSNEDVIVIFYDDALFGETVRTLNFVSENTYWIYVGDSGLFDLHIREYFTREK